VSARAVAGAAIETITPATARVRLIVLDVVDALSMM
jgi:hypothetical protein